MNHKLILLRFFCFFSLFINSPFVILANLFVGHEFDSIQLPCSFLMVPQDGVYTGLRNTFTIYYKFTSIKIIHKRENFCRLVYGKMN